MEKEVFAFLVDGLNVDENGFNWKNRLILTNNAKKTPRIALAVVLVDKKEDLNETQEVAYHILTLFLTCYQLLHEINPYVLNGFVYTSKNFPSEESVFPYASGLAYSTHYEPQVQPELESEVMAKIQTTLPTFETVMTVVDSRKMPSLETALVMYNRSFKTMESIEDLIGMVTVLEALFSDSNSEITYKVALRTAIMIKDKMTNTRDTFDMVKEIYDKRSKLVHGSMVPIRFRKELIPLRMRAETYASLSLLNYIELVGKGMSKNEIIKMLDDRALGIPEQK